MTETKNTPMLVIAPSVVLSWLICFTAQTQRPGYAAKSQGCVSVVQSGCWEATPRFEDVWESGFFTKWGRHAGRGLVANRVASEAFLGETLPISSLRLGFREACGLVLITREAMSDIWEVSSWSS